MINNTQLARLVGQVSNPESYAQQTAFSLSQARSGIVGWMVTLHFTEYRFAEYHLAESISKVAEPAKRDTVGFAHSSELRQGVEAPGLGLMLV
jgi:hypothetical protein